jgi:flagellar motor component MotA
MHKGLHAAIGPIFRTEYFKQEESMNPKAMVQTMIALASASLGLVAALAWNEAIKALLAELNLGDSLAGLFAYAIIATLVAVIVLVYLGKLASRVGGDAAFEREAEG